MRNRRDKRIYIIIGLCAILVVMAIGYAAFGQLLTINGTATNTNGWCIGFDNTETSAYTVTKGKSTGQTPTGSISFSGTACSTKLVQTASISSVFYQPGDQIEYTFTIRNASTVDAELKSILIDNQSVTTDTTITKGNIQYIVHMPDGGGVINATDFATMKIIAKFQNDTNISGQYSGETQTIQIKLNVEQDSGNGGMDYTYSGMIYSWSGNLVNIGDLVMANYCAHASQGGNEVNSCEVFNLGWNTKSECETFIEENPELMQQYGLSDVTCVKDRVDLIDNASLDPSDFNKDYYLKHEIVENRVTASYICAKLNNQEYCLQGADNGSSFAANTQLIRTYQAIYNLNEVANPSEYNPGCEYTNTDSYCYGGDFWNVGVDSYGDVYAYDSANSRCSIGYAGEAFCADS